MNFNDLLGLTITEISGAQAGNDEIIFSVSDGRKFRLMHWQDCCENVDINDIEGDIADLVGIPLIQAEEVSDITMDAESANNEGLKWTFYKLGTQKGYVTIRWYGASNGFYSESVNFEQIV